MRFCFSTPVWGDNHLNLFKTVCLPSLLAPDNLPALKDASECLYLIYTRPDDEVRLRRSAAFRRLEKLMPVQVKLIQEPIEVPHTVMTDCHADTLRQADADGVGAIFIPPDCVWADGCMTSVERIAESGKSVVHTTGIRLNRDTMLPELLKHLRDRKSTLQMKPRDLVKLGLNHLHNIAYSHFWNEHDGGLMPANLYWTVPGEGLLVRCFHLHPLMVKPQRKSATFEGTIDDDLALKACPDNSKDHIVTDSDEILVFELSSPAHEVGAPFPKGRVESISAWAEIGTNERHRELVGQTIRIHHAPINDETWARMEEQADEVVQKALKINRRWMPVLAITNPAVLIWRGYAWSLGKVAPSRRQRIAMFARKLLGQRIDWARRLSFTFSQ